MKKNRVGPKYNTKNGRKGRRKKERSIEEMRKSYLIKAIRKITLYWEPRKAAIKRQSIRGGSFQCEICKKVKQKGSRKVDHIHPIVPTSGWDSWDGYIERALCKEENWQILCTICHQNKSNIENDKRRNNKSNDEAFLFEI